MLVPFDSESDSESDSYALLIGVIRQVIREYGTKFLMLMERSGIRQGVQVLINVLRVL